MADDYEKYAREKLGWTSTPDEDRIDTYELQAVFDDLAQQTAKAYRQYARRKLGWMQAEFVAAKAAREAFRTLARLRIEFDPDGNTRLPEDLRKAWAGPLAVRALLKTGEQQLYAILNRADCVFREGLVEQAAKGVILLIHRATSSQRYNTVSDSTSRPGGIKTEEER